MSSPVPSGLGKRYRISALAMFCIMLALPPAGHARSCGSMKAVHGNLHNKGKLKFEEVTCVRGNLSNDRNGSIAIKGVNTLITGHTINNGTLDILHANVDFQNGLQNNGALLFDPSTITVTTMTIGTNGYLAETGGPGDRFIITEDFINQSIRNLDWSTANTIFQFNGGLHDINDPQTLEVAGTNLGNLTVGWADNFVFGTLQIGTSYTYVKLLDNYDNSASCLNGYCETTSSEAIYVNELILEDGATLDLSGLNLYVRTTFTDNGGIVVNGTVSVGEVTFIPGDINADGIVNVADVLLAQRHVTNLITLSSEQIMRGDVYPSGAGDGSVTISDVLLIIQIGY